MYNIINFLLSQSILIPIIIGFVRIKRLGKTYYPFFILLLIGFAAELVGFIFIETYRISNAPVVKVYSLLECYIILYLLYLWKNSNNYFKVFVFLLGVCTVFWFIETFVFTSINTFSPYFRGFYAFVIVLLSINQINAMMFYHEGALFKNPRFILSLGFIIFFFYQIIYEASYFVGSEQSVVANKIIMGFGYINFVINLLYAVAIFFIDPKNDEYNYYFKEQ